MPRPFAVLSSLRLLGASPRSRLFFAAHAQSSLGTGAGYAALVAITYERGGVAVGDRPRAARGLPARDGRSARCSARSPTAGRGAAAWPWPTASRRRPSSCSRSVEGLGATLALALLAGLGAGLFGPAALAGLPGVVGRERLPAGTALYGAVADLGARGRAGARRPRCCSWRARRRSCSLNGAELRHRRAGHAARDRLRRRRRPADAGPRPSLLARDARRPARGARARPGCARGRSPRAPSCCSPGC